VTQMARAYAGPGCHGSLEGRRRDAVYCSASCRSRARHHRNDLSVQRRASEVLDALPPGLRTFAEDVARAVLRGAEITIRMPR
jgi:hypothetical protein